MPNKPLCFIDVETTGTTASNGRIIEVGILRVENDELVTTYQTLLNPELRIDPFIESMTGINSTSLEYAPTFSDIKDKLLELLEGSIFVAHNVRFDYGFIRHEFRRCGISFTSKHFCTVKLARLLYPTLGKYNLDSIIANFGFENENRHRAFDDAKVLWDFYKYSKQNTPEDVFSEAINTLLKKPTLPPGLRKEDVDNLPEGPGVYIFYGEAPSAKKENDESLLPLYIGKSVNIKERVLSHFTNDYLSGTDMKISQQIKSIEAIETAGELSALLLESTLIKKHQPLLNRMLRNARNMTVVVKSIDDNGYNTISFKEAQDLDLAEIENILGVFKNLKTAKDYIYQIAKDHGLCPRIMGLDKGKGRCFYSQINQCLGACGGDEINLKYNLRFDQGFFTTKVKPWRFNGPIVIKEMGGKEETHLIDKWCYLGSLKADNPSSEQIDFNYKFDFDTYKILKRYILNPKNQKFISKFNSVRGESSNDVSANLN